VATAAADSLGYALRRLFRGFVFPDADGKPSGDFELRVSVEVARLVGGDFCRPVGIVAANLPLAMIGATVPEASVDEDCH